MKNVRGIKVVRDHESTRYLKKLRSSTHFRSMYPPAVFRGEEMGSTIVNIEAASNNKWPAILTPLPFFARYGKWSVASIISLIPYSERKGKLYSTKNSINAKKNNIHFAFHTPSDCPLQHDVLFSFAYLLKKIFHMCNGKYKHIERHRERDITYFLFLPHSYEIDYISGRVAGRYRLVGRTMEYSRGG